MTDKPTTLERAFQLARTGEYTLTQIIRRLNSEGFFDARSQLDGSAVRRQIKGMSDEARRVAVN